MRRSTPTYDQHSGHIDTHMGLIHVLGRGVVWRWQLTRMHGRRASVICAEAPVAFEEMKVADLKAELVARGAARSRAKGVLHQSRLHALIVQSAVERARGGVEEDDI